MATVPELRISTDKVCFIVVKARQFQVKDVVTEPDPASNASDDNMRSVLESHANDPVGREIVSAFEGLNSDERIDLVALVRLGRGDGDLSEWKDLQTDAPQELSGDGGEALLGIPLLADYLEEGLSLIGESCQGFEAEYE